MRFGYTLIYVDDVPATLAQWQAAFGLETRYLHEDGIYGEVETGDGGTTLAFVHREFGRGHFEDDDARAHFDGRPGCLEIALLTDDVPAAYARAVGAGLTAIRPPFTQAWGQVVGWVKDAAGVLVELATPMD
jgi:lactoylglutathione lyase